MNKYEAMFIIKPDLSEEEKKSLFNQIGETITKNNGIVNEASVWAERRKLYFSLKRNTEGLYYLVKFLSDPSAIKDLKHNYKLNENILRSMISKIE